MYIISITVIGLIIVLFGSTIFKIITSNSNTQSSNKIGNIWFVCLLILNIFIIIFLYMYTNLKLNQVGNKGKSGEPGISGQDGDPCSFPDTKTVYYANYISSPTLIT